MSDSSLPQRRSIRLPRWSYTGEAVYFITICALRRRCIFGAVRNSSMCLSALGRIVDREWHAIAKHRPRVRLGECVVMPNHLHGILSVRGVSDPKGAGMNSCAAKKQGFGDIQPCSLGAILRSYKSSVTRCVREELGDPSLIVWQRNYYEHVIRDMGDYDEIRGYILNNPERWPQDRHFVQS